MVSLRRFSGGIPGVSNLYMVGAGLTKALIEVRKPFALF